MRHKFVLILIMCFSINETANGFGLSKYWVRSKTGHIMSHSGVNYKFEAANSDKVAILVNKKSGIPYLWYNGGNFEMKIPDISIHTYNGSMKLHNPDNSSMPVINHISNKIGSEYNFDKSNRHIAMVGKSLAEDRRFEIVSDSSSGGLSKYVLSRRYGNDPSEFKAMLYVKRTEDNEITIKLPIEVKNPNIHRIDNPDNKISIHNSSDENMQKIILKHNEDSIKFSDLRHKVNKNGNSELIIEFQNTRTGEVTEFKIEYHYPQSINKPFNNLSQESAMGEGVG